MHEAPSIEFSFVHELPKKKKLRAVAAVEFIQLLKAAFSQHGAVIPKALAAKFLGISPQRVHQLCESGTLVTVEIDGHGFVTEDSLVAFGKSERKTGRPPRLKSAADALEIAKEYAADE